MRQEDFHIHSVYSDGSDTPAQIMELASQNGIVRLALTDHDTISGLDTAAKEARKHDIQFVPGIEFSVRYNDNRLIHILGLGIDVQATDFLTPYNRYKKHREDAVEHVLSHLKVMGVDVTFEALRPFSYDCTIDRQAIAKYLVAAKHASSIPEAWIQYLDRIPYLEKELLLPTQAFDMIHAAGGKAYIAHIHKPIGLYGFDRTDQLKRLEQLMLLGLDGIESHYPSFSAEDLAFIQDAVKRLGLMECGGSDYHGAYRKEVTIGD